MASWRNCNFKDGPYCNFGISVKLIAYLGKITFLKFKIKDQDPFSDFESQLYAPINVAATAPPRDISFNEEPGIL